VYTSWGEASKAVNEFSNAAFKKFKTLDAALEYSRAYGGKAVLRTRYTGPNTYPTCSSRNVKSEDSDDDDDIKELVTALSRVLLSARKSRR
jgi:viroplasmin and RNaseH domain-containing protein